MSRAFWNQNRRVTKRFHIWRWIIQTRFTITFDNMNFCTSIFVQVFRLKNIFAKNYRNEFYIMKLALEIQQWLEKLKKELPWSWYEYRITVPRCTHPWFRLRVELKSLMKTPEIFYRWANAELSSWFACFQMCDEVLVMRLWLRDQNCRVLWECQYFCECP